MRDLHIELSAKYDYDLSRFYFDESIERLGDSEDEFLYTGFGNLPSYSLSEIIPEIRNNDSNKRKLARYVFEEEYTKCDTIKEVLEDYCIYGLIEDVLGYHEDISHDALETLFDELKITYDTEFVQIETKGYSQGDYAKVWVNIKDYKEIFGVELNEDELRKQLDNLFWDSLIVGSLKLSFDYTVNCVNYNISLEIEHLDEILKDSYDLDIDTDVVLSMIEKQMLIPLSADNKKIIVDELKKFDYTDISYPCAC